jgi:hypothetical protein
MSAEDLVSTAIGGGLAIMALDTLTNRRRGKTVVIREAAKKKKPAKGKLARNKPIKRRQMTTKRKTTKATKRKSVTPKTNHRKSAPKRRTDHVYLDNIRTLI